MRLKGKVAIITGGGQGIGAGVATMFAAEGAAVTIAARTKERLEAVAADISAAGGQVLAVPTDMRSESDVERMVQETVNAFGRLDILVNNAGIPWFGFPVDAHFEAALARYDDIMATNVRGPWVAVHFAVPHMKAAGGGSIINISSVHGKAGADRGSAYSASKGALEAMTRALAIELAPYAIRVNAVAPGLIDVSKMHIAEELRAIGEQERADELMEAYARYCATTQPLRRMGKAEDVAWACTYLAADEARFVTGITLTVDGGSTAMLAEPIRFSRHAMEAVDTWHRLLAAARELIRARQAAN